MSHPRTLWTSYIIRESFSTLFVQLLRSLPENVSSTNVANKIHHWYIILRTALYDYQYHLYSTFRSEVSIMNYIIDDWIAGEFSGPMSVTLTNCFFIKRRWRVAWYMNSSQESVVKLSRRFRQSVSPSSIARKWLCKWTTIIRARSNNPDDFKLMSQFRTLFQIAMQIDPSH